MSQFSYQATNADGKQVKGTIEGVNRDEVIQQLVAQNLKPREVILLTEGKASRKFFKKKVKTEQLVLFIRQLSTMVSAGVPLMRALTTLESQAENPALKEAIREIAKERGMARRDV